MSTTLGIAFDDNLKDFEAIFQPDNERSVTDVEARHGMLSPVMNFLSLLEIGCFTGALPSTLPLHTSEAVKRASSEQSSMVNDRLLLPLLAVDRALNGGGPVSSVLPIDIYFYLLDFVQKFQSDQDIATFLEMMSFPLEASHPENIRLPTEMREILSDSQTLAGVLHGSGTNQTSEYTPAVRGFFALMSYISELIEILNSIHECKTTRSAIWHHHVRLFSLITDTGLDTIHECLIELGAEEIRQSLKDADRQMAYDEVVEGANASSNAIRGLVQGRNYSEALVEVWKERGAPGGVEELEGLASGTQQWFNPWYWSGMWRFQDYVDRIGHRMR